MTVYSDEIDLRPVVRILLKNWWRILLLGLIAAVAGLSFSLSKPRVYQATATVLVTRTRASLSLADQFQTVNEPIDTRSRMDAILSIANNDNVALQTYDMVKDQLSGISFKSFRGAVEVSSEGDLVIISASMEDPTIATEIANTWTDLAVKAINNSYSAQLFPEEIQSQLIPARQEYLGAQSELEKFIQTDQSYLLEKQVEETQAIVDNILKDKTWLATYLTQRKQNLEQIIIQAEALKNQLDEGKLSSAAEIGDALAVLRARASTFEDIQHQQVIIDKEQTDVTNSTYNFQFLDISSLIDTTSNASQDLNNFIQQANVEKQKTEANLKAYYIEVTNNPEESTLTGIVNHLQELQTQLEQATAQKTELTNKRDSAWLAYKNLSEKETELKNAYPTNNQVNISNRAVKPQVPESRGTIIITVAAGFVGGLIGSLWFLLTPWLRSIRELPSDPQEGDPS